MNQNCRCARRVAAVGSAAACILYVGAVGAAAQTPPAGAQTDSLTELGACVSSRGSLDVLLLMDETESLIHEVKDGTISPDRPGADAAHNRIPAARSFVEQLLERQQDQGFTTNIRIAGFGQNYNATPENASIYGTWMPLTVTSIGDVTGIIDGPGTVPANSTRTMQMRSMVPTQTSPARDPRTVVNCWSHSPTAHSRTKGRPQRMSGPDNSSAPRRDRGQAAEGRYLPRGDRSRHAGQPIRLQSSAGDDRRW